MTSVAVKLAVSLPCVQPSHIRALLLARPVSGNYRLSIYITYKTNFIFLFPFIWWAFVYMPVSYVCEPMYVCGDLRLMLAIRLHHPSTLCTEAGSLNQIQRLWVCLISLLSSLWGSPVFWGWNSRQASMLTQHWCALWGPEHWSWHLWGKHCNCGAIVPAPWKFI